MSSNLNDLINRYTIRYSDKLKKICEPLDTYLRMPKFAYYSIENDGRFGVVCNYPEGHEDFFGQKLYMNCPYLTHPGLFRSGYALIPATTNQNLLANEDFSHLFLILKKQADKMEGFFFSAPDLKPQTCRRVVNQIDLLNQFCLYFKRETHDLMMRIHEDGYNLHQAKGNAFLTRDANLPLSSQNVRTQEYFKKINHLTRQEQACLDLFKQGNTAKMTAEVLGLSRRTVEHHFDRIKDKLGCSSKWELLDK